MERKKLELLMSVVLIFCACILAERGWERVMSSQVQAEEKKWTVVIDAGHGGNDPGKIGVDDSLEKDLNLIIAKKVQKLLEQQDVKVVMTRETDAGLYEEQTSNKKVQDMKNRCTLINDTQPDCVVSIHQNSYHEESIHGAQVFYYKHSAQGEQFAAIMQKALLSIDKENRRQPKADDTYYLLKKTEVPTVIVECGFLSNPEEAEKLVTEEYQQQIAEAIVKGIEACMKE